MASSDSAAFDSWLLRSTIVLIICASGCLMRAHVGNPQSTHGAPSIAVLSPSAFERLERKVESKLVEKDRRWKGKGRPNPDPGWDGPTFHFSSDAGEVDTFLRELAAGNGSDDLARKNHTVRRIGRA